MSREPPQHENRWARVQDGYRPRRRRGWFDATLVRQAVQVAGIQGLVLTKLDVLDGLPELKIGVGCLRRA